MMTSSSCKHDKKDLVLHFYGELDEEYEVKIKLRIQDCSRCKEYYAELVSMETMVPRTPSVEPDEAVMVAIRNATGRRLRQIAGQRSGMSESLRVLWSIPIWARVSIVTAVAMLVFVGGLYSGRGGVLAPQDAGDTVIADISDIIFDEKAGEVLVEYRTLGVNSVRGSLADEKVLTLLKYALTDADKPATRLRAVKMLNMVDSDVAQPDQELVSALGGIIRDDPNNGMKLQAIMALRKVYVGAELDGEMSDLLMQVLDTSPNSALRIEALKLLTESELARQDLARVLARAVRDENSAVRFRARTALDDLSETIPLERLK